MSRNHPLRIALAIFAAIALSLAFVACAADDDAPAPAPTPAPAPAPAPAPEPEPDDAHDHEHAVYRIEYEALISANPLFQALFGAMPYPEGVGTAPHIAFFAHPMGESLWELGGMASPGLKVLAETGESADLLAEAEAAGYTVIFSSEEEITALLTSDDPMIEVEHDQPCFSYAQMIAPSTDWFVGFSSVCTVDENGEWMHDVELEAYAFDAGTAMGEDFMLKAEGGDTMEPITYLEVEPFGEDSPVSRIHAEEVHE